MIRKLIRTTIKKVVSRGAIAKDYQISVEELTHTQIIQWFENDSKAKREQGGDAGNLQW